MLAMAAVTFAKSKNNRGVTMTDTAIETLGILLKNMARDFHERGYAMENAAEALKVLERPELSNEQTARRARVAIKTWLKKEEERDAQKSTSKG